MHINILNDIIYDKKIWLKNHKKKQPLSIIKQNLNVSDRSFYNVVQKTRPFFILEAKQASPITGIINKNFNITEIATCYKQHASIISVLTDEKYFHGQFNFLNEMYQLVDQPILCKDFIIDPYQVYLARYYNAHAILLMLSILNDNQYTILANIAHSMNMGVLTEINNQDELNRSIMLKSKVIGINNRNFNNLSINFQKTYELAPLIPKNKIIISESGITDHNDIKQLKKLVHGFLIGSCIMKSTDITLKTNQIIFGNNKICGLTRSKDAIRSRILGAIYGGLIFVPKSIRYITLTTAHNIIQSSKLKYVGVFQNEKIEKIIFLVKHLNLYAIQLHGQEDQKYIIQLRNQLPNYIKIWKALYIKNQQIDINLKYINHYVFDNLYGGSGICFNWKYIKNINLKSVILSGGLSIQNYKSAYKLDCFGLDFNSQLEKSPGIKDFHKLKMLFNKIKMIL